MMPSLVDMLAASVLANWAMRWADFCWDLQCMGFIHLVEIREPVVSFEFLSILQGHLVSDILGCIQQLQIQFDLSIWM